MGYLEIKEVTGQYKATLVAVSKTKPESAILEIYEQGHHDFGENRVQELLSKYEALPKDIKWHMIGHLQKNKVKYIVPFVHLIHSVDSVKLLNAILKEGRRNNRQVDVLLQLKIAKEESKYGLNTDELIDIISNEKYRNSLNIRIRGIMGMASFVADLNQLKGEFKKAKDLFDQVSQMQLTGMEHFDTLSMGMSGDYKLALDSGSNMVRVGSLIFGAR